MEIKTYCLKLPVEENEQIKKAIVKPKQNMNDWILQAIREKIQREAKAV